MILTGAEERKLFSHVMALASMTVTAPDFDERLHGYSSVEVDGVCHALTTEYIDGDPTNATECGIDVEEDFIQLATGPREEFLGESEMCPDCWPSGVIE